MKILLTVIIIMVSNLIIKTNLKMEPNNSLKNKNINNIINNKTSINTTFQKIIKLQEGLKIK